MVLPVKLQKFLLGWYSPSLLACVLLLVYQLTDAYSIKLGGLAPSSRSLVSTPVSNNVIVTVVSLIFWFDDFIVWLLFLCVFIGAIIVAITKSGVSYRQRFRFVALNCVVLVVAWNVPYYIAVSRFYLNLKPMESVVNLVYARKLPQSPISRQEHPLPEHLKGLSRDGCVRIFDDRDSSDLDLVDLKSVHVVFGIHKMTDIEYCADDKLSPGDFLGSGRLAKNWFWYKSSPLPNL